MTTINEINKYLSKKLIKDPKSAKGFIRFHEKADRVLLGEGEPFEISYSRLFLDEYMPTSALVAGYMMARFHYMLIYQQAIIIPIAVCSSPRGNEFKLENNEILESVAEPFQASFDGDTHGEDGFLEWNAVEPLAPRHKVFNGLGRSSYTYPLEVGHCPVLTLWIRLIDWGGWVRWPYGSRFLYLFVADIKHNTSLILNTDEEHELNADTKLDLKPKQLSLFD